ncbi:MAG: hypothetical protein GWO20_14525, partial [Candidatus Korarchaeota archaeon]|nr:hypothetical protein [Candidatus Korarchaeota archaeon]NIU84638.1 hypothetical protein [Candidatus Thorarchaeota archaeon]NIW52740.1 hypothetical protein [Candidatus Korarchaeota archaeon]
MHRRGEKMTARSELSMRTLWVASMTLIIMLVLPFSIVPSLSMPSTGWRGDELDSSNPKDHQPVSVPKVGDMPKTTLPTVRNNEKLSPRRIPLTFREISFTTSGNKVIPRINGCQLTYPPGKPIMPVYTHKIKLPSTAFVEKVTTSNLSRETITFPSKVQNSPRPFPLTEERGLQASKVAPLSPTIEDPSTQRMYLEYRVVHGIDASTLKRHNFLVIRFFPLWYTSSTQATFVKSAEVKVHLSYGDNRKIAAQNDEDLRSILITSNSLATAAERLASYKNSTGIPTKVAYVEAINATYAGRDTPERIRKFLQDKVSSSGAEFLIILGDADVLPPRYVYIPDGAYDNDPETDGKYVETDLYYADLFGTDDDSWDDNDDGRWGDLQYDTVDAVPDLLTGRLPASNQSEAKVLVDKIINYEPPRQRTWGVFAGTDTFQMGYPEGEFLSEYMIDQYAFDNGTITRLYETAGNLSRGSFIEKINQEPSLVSFAGHGLARSLMLGMEEYTCSDALRQHNRNSKPIFVDLACLAARFADYDCVGEALLLNEEGGGMGYLGSTRLAWGYISELVKTGLAGEMLWRIVKSYYSPLRKNLGRIWGNSISGYVTNNPINCSFSTGQEAVYLNWKTVAERVLLGDPTLSLVPETYENTTSSFGEIEITNTTTFQNVFHKHTGGDIFVRESGHLTISDSYFELNDAAIHVKGGQITLQNSSLVGSRVLSINGTITINQSKVVGIVTKLIQGESVIMDSVLDTLKLEYGCASNVSVANSSVDLFVQANGLEKELTLHNDFYETLNLSQIFDVNVTVTTSFLLFSLTGRDMNLTFTDSNLNTLQVTQSNLTVLQSSVEDLQVNQSSLIVQDSSVSVNLSIVEDEDISDLGASGEFNRQVAGTNLMFVNSSVNWGITVDNNASVDLRNSKVSFLILDSGSATCDSTRITYLTERQNSRSFILTSGRVMRFSSNAPAEIEDSQAYAIYSTDTLQIDNSSLELLAVMEHASTVNVKNANITQFTAIGGTTTLYGSTIVYSSVRSDAVVHVIESKLAVLDCYDSSIVDVSGSKVVYWLRCFENTTVDVTDSAIWLGLSFRNAQITLTGVKSGNVDSLLLTFGWDLNVTSSFLYGIDLLLYDANLTVADSELSRVFCYCKTTVTIRKSHVMLLRGTHHSEIDARQTTLEEVYISGESVVSIEQAEIGTLYCLGQSQVEILSASVDVVVGYGHSNVRLEYVRGGMVAPFDTSNISVRRSDVIFYLTVENASVSLQGFQPTYASQWTSEDLPVNTSWIATVRDSKLQWTIDVTNSNASIEESALYSLYLTNSHATVENVKIVEFFAVFSSSLEVDNLNVDYLSFLVRTSGTIRNSYLSLMLYSKSNVTIFDSVLIPYLYITGNASLTLKPGTFTDLNLSELGSTPPELSLRLIDSSVIAWGVLAYDGGNVSIQNSTLIGAEIYGVSQLTISNSLVFGYVAAIYPDETMKLRLINSSFKLSLWLYDSIFTLKDWNTIERAISWKPLPGVRLTDSTVFGLDLHGTGSEVYAINSVIESVEASQSSVAIVESNVEAVTLTRSSSLIDESVIGSVSARSSTLGIIKSDINSFAPIYSQADVVQSEIGLTRTLHFTAEAYEDLNPHTISSERLTFSHNSIYLSDVV